MLLNAASTNHCEGSVSVTQLRTIAIVNTFIVKSKCYKCTLQAFVHSVNVFFITLFSHADWLSGIFVVVISAMHLYRSYHNAEG